MPIYRFIRLRYVTYDFLCIVAMRSSGVYVGVLDKVGGARPLKQAPWLSLAHPLLIGVVLAVRTHQPEAEVIEQTWGVVAVVFSVFHFM